MSVSLIIDYLFDLGDIVISFFYTLVQLNYNDVFDFLFAFEPITFTTITTNLTYSFSLPNIPILSQLLGLVGMPVFSLLLKPVFMPANSAFILCFLELPLKAFIILIIIKLVKLFI